MRFEHVCRETPLWMSFAAVSLSGAAVWGILTLLQRDAIVSLPVEIRSVVFALTALGNILTALSLLIFWPLIATVLYCIGVLMAPKNPPRFSDFLSGIGLAHLPIMVSLISVWIIVLTSEIPVQIHADAGGELLKSLMWVRVCRWLVSTAYLMSLAGCAATVRSLFQFPWPKAALVTFLPVSIYALIVWLA